MNEHENEHEYEHDHDFESHAPDADSSASPTEGDVTREEELPFGMAGISDLLDRLADGVELGEWSPRKCRMVAEYVLTLSDGYWLSQGEAAYCRRLIAAA